MSFEYWALSVGRGVASCSIVFCYLVGLFYCFFNYFFGGFFDHDFNCFFFKGWYASEGTSALFVYVGDDGLDFGLLACYGLVLELVGALVNGLEGVGGAIGTKSSTNGDAVYDRACGDDLGGVIGAMVILRSYPQVFFELFVAGEGFLLVTVGLFCVGFGYVTSWGGFEQVLGTYPEGFEGIGRSIGATSIGGDAMTYR